MKSYGYVWHLAIAHLLAVTPAPEGLLYLSKDGELQVVAEEEDAPLGSRLVVRLSDSTDPAHAAARLAYIATTAG